MDDAVSGIARAAAARLSTDLGGEVVVGVEEALQAQEGGASPKRYFDPISLGSLIVSVASLAWTVLRDLRRERAKPSPDVVARRVRVQLSADIAATQRDLIVDVVVDEMLSGADQGEPED